ncbi:MAG: helix-turn-helix domain-containing protein [Cyanobacteria bacterium]|nr:helix-turn-helix domain-containing protein [Cyanobacteriota bacterium]
MHSGVFVERQYCSFAGIVHGQKSTDFLKALVERRFATPITTGKLHRGRMFHVHYKPLWGAIGQPDNRFRKPAAQGRMIERVMLLDAVLDDRDFVWLGPSTDKHRHFIRHLGDRLEHRDYPHLMFVVRQQSSPAGALDTAGARCTMKPWLNVSEAAEYASLSRDTIYTACERGELRSARVSGRRAIRIRPAWIDAWLERHAPDVQYRRRIGDTPNGATS